MLLTAFALAASRTAKADPDVDLCVKAAAATDHSSIQEVDRDGCECATKQLRLTLHGRDYELHQKMMEIIASGADEKSFDKQLSDIMLKRGMNQHDADAFLARSKTAENKAQSVCNATSPLLNPKKTR